MVAGIQFWITQYIVEVLQVEYRDALGAFTVVSATGPVFGVVFGGWLVDYLGGYKGKEVRAESERREERIFRLLGPSLSALLRC